MRKKSFEYQHYNHSVGLAIVHLVFVPKRRKPVLKGDIRNRLYQVWQDLATEKGWNIRACEIAPDHVHLFIEFPPTMPIHLVVKFLKGRASNILRKEFPELLKLPSLWSKSYFFSTAGNVSATTIQKYIEDPHHH
ncbi:IS200/IS605 family transposase [Planktothrix mougeotii]|uniref:IS200/IS605 family transposase n=1 Tax=Planktothrix mougeotii LEGE 06226 TaxID=1828728 RepID=A0ABR9UJZ2_9CYAN|nr:IS200/IS605 family transposase [Planktothrix mougeotii]MBE9146784.1 IS200/IS605 family transposase [Planktothrix mougeotii LEGE 06226]